jgi:hypothetical protein
MLKIGDDLPKLFCSLGGNGAALHSANKIASRDAEQRWPLLKAMPPKEPPQTPLLTAEEKQSWQPLGLSEQVRGSSPRAPSLGDKLALNLKKIAAQARTEQSPKKSNAKTAVVAAAQKQESPPAPTLHTAPEDVLTSSHQGAGRTTTLKKKTLVTDNKADAASGVIRSKKELIAELPAAHTPPLDDSLKSVFRRLEPVKKETKPPVTEKRPSYLDRLGRK